MPGNDNMEKPPYILLTALFALNTLDCLTTLGAVSTPDAIEANQLMDTLITSIGLGPLMILKFFFGLFAVSAIVELWDSMPTEKRKTIFMPVLGFVTTLYAVGTLMNVLGIIGWVSFLE